MKLRRYSQWKFGVVLGLGVLVALVLCAQCVRTYFYTDAVLVPQQAEHEAVRQAGALSAAARSAGVSNPRALGPVIERALEAASDRVLWMRVLDPAHNVVAQGGSPQGMAQFPPGWRNRIEKHETPGMLIATPEGKALVVMLPLRIARPPHPIEGEVNPHGHPPAPYMLELAISLKSVASSYEGLRENLIVGLIASVALLVSVAVIGFRARPYLRGKYLESELQLARRVQSDLQPKQHSVSRDVEFAASAVAADHVGGDFYDIFEAESGEIVIVLGDVSGKGVPAALLVSVLHGAIRSSTAARHEYACERINRMLCERTACERFATLFWGVFDPLSGTLRYVNAGHAAPMLVRSRQNRVERLSDGGPILGMLPNARYSAGTVKIEYADKLVLYSDGISEAANAHEEEFGEDRIERMSADMADASPAEFCQRILNQVTAFANGEASADDRTLMVVKFADPRPAMPQRTFDEVMVDAVA